MAMAMRIALTTSRVCIPSVLSNIHCRLASSRITVITMSFDLSTIEGVASFDSHLALRSYASASGFFPTQLDGRLFEMVKQPPSKNGDLVNFCRWYNHIASFSADERNQWPDATLASCTASQSHVKSDDLNRITEVKKVEICERTDLAYLHDTYKFVDSGVVVATGAEQRGAFCCLDSTIFYPQGGGQPSDVGTLDFDDGEVFKVNFVNMLPNGRVQHFTDRPVDSSRIGQRVVQRLDGAARLENAKAHTGGHLLNCVVEQLAPELVGSKGYHFKQGPYVEFEGKLTSMSVEDLRTSASRLIGDAIRKGAAVTAREVTPEEVTTLRVAARYHLPQGKAARLVQIQGFEAVPCGGTHLRNVSELQEVTIRKIQQPKGNVKIGYTVVE